MRKANLKNDFYPCYLGLFAHFLKQIHIKHNKVMRKGAVKTAFGFMAFLFSIERINEKEKG